MVVRVATQEAFMSKCILCPKKEACDFAKLHAVFLLFFTFLYKVILFFYILLVASEMKQFYKEIDFYV